ncbi:MAG TPA: hypothetical protein EYP74_03675 [Anaerolineales bacterium]|nr:hypothetical protein [Anaerolineales bacterium]
MTEEKMSPPIKDESIENGAENAQQRKILIIAAVFFLFILFGIVAAVVGLLQPNAPTEKIRDIFIIFIAFESLVIGVALIILIIQASTFINLLQNEMKPILDATNETIHTLRGTTAFLSENVAEPVIKLNANLAGLSRILKVLGVKGNKK